MNKEISPKLVALSFGILVLVFAVGFYILAWTEPTQAPPGGNVATPLNISDIGQTKAGWLATLKSFFVGSEPTDAEKATTGVLRTTGGAILNTGGANIGLIVQQGKVGIGTAELTQLLHLFKLNDDAAVRFQVGQTSGSSVTFNYTGAQQTWVVPAGVTSITVDVRGAGGVSIGGGNNSGGSGGCVQTTISVTPGETLYIYVGGGQGAVPIGGFNGGGNGGDCPGGFKCAGSVGYGGSGASDIRKGGTALSNRVVVAAGGGGTGGGPGGAGGGGGGLIGENGSRGIGFVCGGGMGGGGTQSSGGALNGGLGIGGRGYDGCGASDDYPNGSGGGGGGGGYYGGGGGDGGAEGAVGSGGGGGSSYAVGTDITYTPSCRSGNGQIIITYSTIADVNWVLGVDQSDAGKFKISGSSGLGTKDYLKIDYVTGKTTIPGGIDPPYVSFSGETHESIREYAKNAEKKEETMLFWSAENHRLEIYVINEDKFYTIIGEPIAD